MKKFLIIIPAAALLLAGHVIAADAEAAWWNTAWTQRQTLTLDTGSDAAALTDSPGTATVLVRLSDASGFPFASAREDGSDLRFIAADGKTARPSDRKL